MSTENHNDLLLSEPWLIQLDIIDQHELSKSIDNVTEQAAQLALNEQNQPASLKGTSSWSEHEKLTGEILNEAAKRTAAETFANVRVYHPTQNHMPSKDGPNIRPDYIIAWSYNGVRKNTAVVDAKDYQGNVPRREYDKICRDMQETKATRGILVLSESATIGDKLLADIQKDGKVDIVHLQGERADAVRAVSQHIGKMIDQNFVPDDNRWKTYQSYVSSTDNPKELRPNPHGTTEKYTSNGTYHQFNHPRKQDGTVDERFAANRDRNQDGGPDMRMPHNKTKQAQEQHLNADGSEEMRTKEHREDLVDQEGHHLNVDGSPDMRCKENKADLSSGGSVSIDDAQPAASADMRAKENREELVDNAGHHLNVDGSPDMRFKENQEDVGASSSNELQASTNQITPEKTAKAIPTKSDGTADMRFNASKEAVASGTIEPDEPLAGSSGAMSAGDSLGCSEGSALADIPTKSDGTADMRFNASQDAVASGAIGQDQVLSGDGGLSMGGAAESLSGMLGGMEGATGFL